jgi:hypothetical protein
VLAAYAPAHAVGGRVIHAPAPVVPSVLTGCA